MPSTSAKQHKFMEAVAHNPEFAKKAGVPQSVGKEFSAADKAQKARPDLQGINKQKTDHGSMNLFKKGGVMKESKAEDRKEMAEDKKQDVKLIKKAFKEHDTQEHKGGKGTKLTLKKGGMAMKESMGPRTMAKDVEAGSNKLTKFGQSAVQKRAMTKGTNLGDSGPSMGMMGGMKKGGKIKKMASGGMTSSRADGVAQRGKTKTKYC